MNSTVSAVIFGLFMALILLAGVVNAWQISRGNSRDTLRSVRLKHLSYAVIGSWLLILVLMLFIPASWDGHIVRDLMRAVYFGMPLTAAIIWAFGRWAHRNEQKAARADQRALGLTVAPRRISPHTLILLYGIGLFTVVPLAVAGGVLAIALAARDGLATAKHATILWLVLNAVVLTYLTIAAVHIRSQRRRVQLEADHARKCNLGARDAELGPTL